MAIKRDLKVVILASSCNFGRDHLQSRLTTALWPLGDKTAIEHLLHALKKQGIKEAVICYGGDDACLRKAVANVDSIEVKFLSESMPLGTAGCMRDAVGDKKDKLILILPATVTNLPDIEKIVEAHNACNTEITVLLEPDNSNDYGKNSSEIYLCESAVLDFVPSDGYFDIKEGLIPILIRNGKNIQTQILKKHSGRFRNRPEYLNAVANYLNRKENFKSYKRTDSDGDVRLADSAKVNKNADLYGPVVVMDNSVVEKDAVIVGPAVIGNDVVIEHGTVVVGSAIWDGVKVGRNCQIRNCLIDKNSTIPDNSTILDEEILCEHNNLVRPVKCAFNEAQSVLEDAAEKTGRLLKLSDPGRFAGNAVAWLFGLILFVAFIWSYWPGIVDLWGIWNRSDEYSSGLLVPFLAVYILWSRREELMSCRIRPSMWGLFAFLAAQAFRLFGLFYMYGSAERLSIIISIAAMVLFIFGWQIFRKVFTVIIFLGLMIPLPRRIHYAVMIPLQNWATSSAVFLLEIIGYPVAQEGNVIHINDTSVAVAEACNGLRMIMAFFVISGLVVLLVRRKWWEKLIILISSLPIGLLCNTLRLAITAIAFTILEGESWEQRFHDFGGYAMMPLALGMIVLELWLITKLTTPPEEKQIVLASK